MHVIHYEHPVADFNAWKQVFDSDPLDRHQSKVRTYRVEREARDGAEDLVLVDLEFDQRDDAEQMLERLREIWGRVDVMHDPTAHIAELVETGTP
jgi:hypothetical protein